MDTFMMMIIGGVFLIFVVAAYVYYRKQKQQSNAATNQNTTTNATVTNVPQQPPGNPVLISAGKPASIVPQHASYPGSNLVDGRYDTFAHSVYAPINYVEIDLLQDFWITQVKIVNREDCCQERFTQHKIFIDGVLVSEADAQGAQVFVHDFQNVRGRVFKLEKPGLVDGVEVPLNLAQIEILGYP